MPAPMDARKEQALLDALGTISKMLGREQEFDSFISYTRFAQDNDPKPSLEEIASHTPTWIQLLSAPLRKLYDDGFDHGYTYVRV